jgi:hypothetical protein
LAYLQIDLTDPDFHRHNRAMAVATGNALRDLLDAAVAAGELARRTDTAALARLVQTILSGSLISWAFYRDGTAEEWVLEDLEAALHPHLSPTGALQTTAPKAGVGKDKPTHGRRQATRHSDKPRRRSQR